MLRKYCKDINVAMGQGIVWIRFGDQWKQFSLSQEMNQLRKRRNGKKNWARTDKNLGRARLASFIVSEGAIEISFFTKKYCRQPSIFQR